LLRRVRRVVQGSSLATFMVLLVLTRYSGEDEIPYPVRLFLDIDPLILVGTLLASHTAPLAFFASLAVLLLSLVVGRAFCGWICPLGALNQLAGRFRRRPRARQRAVHRWSPGQRTKYGVLAALLVASALGLSWIGLLDPISLSIRSFALALGPATELAVREFFNALYRADVGAVSAVSEPIYDVARRSVLSFEQPAFRQAELIGLIALAVLLLNLVRPRFFCRFVCPLGAMLGVVARYSRVRLRNTAECNRCGKCEMRCPGGADPIEAEAGKWRPSECYLCGNCTAVCEQGLKLSIEPPRFGGSAESASEAPGVAGIDAGRRTLLLGAAAGLVTVPLVKVPRLKHLPHPALIRPPGSVPEQEFLSRCVRCGECMKVCLTGGLQPTALEAGLEGMWTPVLVPRMGYCEYNCTLCGQVCPTGAIRELRPAEKQKVHIGTAFVDPGRCLPIALGVECLVCEEHCPTSPKAIRLEKRVAGDATGSPEAVRRPVVEPERCIGCGICEARCPVRDLPAIRVTSIGESRDPDNQYLFDPGSSPAGYG
jgi:polyferredoxin